MVVDTNEIEKVWQEFWKPILNNNEDELNLEQLKKELYDYYMIMGEVSMVYDNLTGGRISKINTDHNIVVDEVEDRFKELAEERVNENLGYLRTDDDSHWYLLPENLVEDFDKNLKELEQCEEDTEKWEETIDNFVAEFDKYRLSGGIGYLKVLIEDENG